jgi:hypothetical protein
MVLKMKETEIANKYDFKARLRGKGFLQEWGVDYFNTYAPVACHNSLRLFVTQMTLIDYEIDAIDVITAFLLAPLSEEVYIKIPDGYKHPYKPNQVIRLLKSLYGLKQAPHDWNQELDAYLQSKNFKHLTSERCIYVGMFHGVLCFILLWVDDMLLGCPNPKISTFPDSCIRKSTKIKIPESPQIP